VCSSDLLRKPPVDYYDRSKAKKRPPKLTHCLECNTPLSGKQRKFCSVYCKEKNFRAVNREEIAAKSRKRRAERKPLKRKPKIDWDLDKARKAFAKEGCTLLADTYKNCATTMPYICSCGESWTTNLGNFLKGHRCGKGKNCTGRSFGNGWKHSFEYVQKFFEDRKCKLLATEYESARTKMPYECQCGRLSKITFDNFQKGHRCGNCWGYNSRGEQAVEDCLVDLGLVHVLDKTESNADVFTPQFRFVTSEANHLSKYDFGIKGSIYTGVIEYQGQQHYWSVNYFAKAKNSLKSNITRDYKKLMFCLQHKIPILVIPYWDLDRVPEIIGSVFAGETPTFSPPPQEVIDFAEIRRNIRKELEIKEVEILCGYLI
jgi:hypothetical protein